MSFEACLGRYIITNNNLYCIIQSTFKVNINVRFSLTPPPNLISCDHSFFFLPIKSIYMWYLLSYTHGVLYSGYVQLLRQLLFIVLLLKINFTFSGITHSIVYAIVTEKLSECISFKYGKVFQYYLSRKCRF